MSGTPIIIAVVVVTLVAHVAIILWLRAKLRSERNPGEGEPPAP